jgi:hypothetical protein
MVRPQKKRSPEDTSRGFMIRKTPDRPASVHPGPYVVGLSYRPGWTLLNRQKQQKRPIIFNLENRHKITFHVFGQLK